MNGADKILTQCGYRGYTSKHSNMLYINFSYSYSFVKYYRQVLVVLLGFKRIAWAHTLRKIAKESNTNRDKATEMPKDQMAREMD